MASESGIITIANLEARSTRDYSTYVDSSNNRRYTDTNIEMWITQAERIVIAYLGKDYDSTAPKAVLYCVTELAHVFANNQMIKDGFLENEQVIEPILTPAQIYMLDNMTKKEQASGRIKNIYGVESRY